MELVKDYHRKALADHVLIRKSDMHFVMRRPDSSFYSINIAEVGGHLVLVGDLTIGGPHGCVSAGGYGFGWFSGVKSIDYLCSKFLKQTWEWEYALEYFPDWIANAEDYGYTDEQVDLLKEFLSGSYLWPWGTPTSHDFYNALDDAGFDMSDGVPGYGYPIADAGWLGAVNEKFSELYTKEQLCETAQ